MIFRQQKQSAIKFYFHTFYTNMKIQSLNFAYNGTSLAFNAQKSLFQRRAKNNLNHEIDKEHPSASDVARLSLIHI